MDTGCQRSDFARNVLNYDNAMVCLYSDLPPVFSNMIYDGDAGKRIALSSGFYARLVPEKYHSHTTSS